LVLSSFNAAVSRRSDRGITTGKPARRDEISKLERSYETDTLPSADCRMVKFTSFEAFVSPTVADIAPMHCSVLLSLLVEVVTIVSPRRYMGLVRSEFADASASGLALLESSAPTFEFCAA
jgi:hypothetical protein